MATNPSKEVLGNKRIRVEREWEYVPIIGNILGTWKNIRADKLGGEICLVIRPEAGDKVFINGKEVEIAPFTEDALNFLASDKEIIDLDTK